MSSISAGTTLTTGLVASSDTSGQLELQSSGVTKLTVSSSGVTIPTLVGANVNLGTNVTGTLPVTNGGTGATTLTGYVKGTGTSALTASSTVPTSDLTGTLGVANGGTGATSLTANNVILGNNTSAVQFVAPGTTGNVLTSNGTTWQSSAPAGGGSWVFINSTTASSSSTVDISGFSSTYDMHAIVFTGVYGEGGSVQLLIRLNCGSGFLGSNYSRTYVFSGTWNSNSGQDGIYIIQSYTSNSQNRISGIVYVPNASATNVLKSCFGLGGTPGTPIISFGGGTNDTTSGVGALTGLRFLMSSGSVFAGTFRLYGIKNS